MIIYMMSKKIMLLIVLDDESVDHPPVDVPCVIACVREEKNVGQSYQSACVMYSKYLFRLSNPSD